MIYIVAGNWTEYSHARGQYDGKNARFVSHQSHLPPTLNGGQQIRLVGTWYKRVNAKELTTKIFDLLKEHQ